MTKAENIRQFLPGYIGGKKIASNATDGQVLRLSDLQDEIAKLHNRQLALKTQIASIITSIKGNKDKE